MQVRREMSLQIRAERVYQRAALLGNERETLPRSVTSHWHRFIKWFFTCKFHRDFVDIVRFLSGGAAVQQIWIIQEMERQHSWKINCVRKVSVVPPSLLASFYCSSFKKIYLFLPFFLSRLLACTCIPQYMKTRDAHNYRLIDSMNWKKIVFVTFYNYINVKYWLIKQNDYKH